MKKERISVILIFALFFTARVFAEESDHDHQFFVRIGAKNGTVNPAESDEDLAVISALGVNRRAGGLKPVISVIPEHSYRCPGMPLFGCGGIPVLVEFSYFFRNGPGFLFSTDLPLRTQFYTSVNTPSQAEIQSGSAYTKYSFHTERKDYGIQYLFLPHGRVRLSPFLLRSDYRRDYQLSQHTYYAFSNGDSAYYLGFSRRNLETSGWKAGLLSEFMILERLFVSFRFAFSELRGTNDERGSLSAPPDFLATLGRTGENPVSLFQTSSGVRIPGAEYTLGARFRLISGLWISLDYQEGLFRRNESGGSYVSTAMTAGDFIATNAIYRQIHSAHSFNERERFARGFVEYRYD